MRRFLDAVRPLRAGEVEATTTRRSPSSAAGSGAGALVVIFTDVSIGSGPGPGPACAAAPPAPAARDHGPHPALEDTARSRPFHAPSTYARAVASGLVAIGEQTLELLRPERRRDPRRRRPDPLPAPRQPLPGAQRSSRL